jgi:hypothetical protein
MHYELQTSDSTVGDRLKKADTFREYCVYDADQVYPEYIVIYTRLKEGQRKEQYQKQRLFLQLPVYWRNCHKNPTLEVFKEMYKVRPRTHKCLQQLASSSPQALKDQITGLTVYMHVVNAQRIENNEIWNRYVRCKADLRSKLLGQGKTSFPSFSSVSDGKGIMTMEELHKFIDVEDVLSADNFDQGLNECLLWHGTSKQAVDSIVATAFHIPKGRSEVTNGSRYGSGAYFAEDLEKSITYAKPDESGTRFVLLCRVACGDVHFTDGDWYDASGEAEELGKTAVLAHTDRRSERHREIIIRNSAQVYPEFVLEVQLTTTQAEQNPTLLDRGRSGTVAGTGKKDWICEKPAKQEYCDGGQL